jgi:hypothetical protein
MFLVETHRHQFHFLWAALPGSPSNFDAVRNLRAAAVDAEAIFLGDKIEAVGAVRLMRTSLGTARNRQVQAAS